MCQKLWKLTECRQSYCNINRVQFFWPTLYMNYEYDRAALKQLEPNNDIHKRNNEVMNQQVLAYTQRQPNGVTCALGASLVGSRRTLPRMQKRAAGGRYLESATSKSDSCQSMSNWVFHPVPIWNDGELGVFEERRPKKNKISDRPMGSFPDPTSTNEL